MKNLLIFSAIMLVACAGGTGPVYELRSLTPSTNPVIYVYRPASIYSGGYTAHMIVANQPKRELKNGSYFAATVAPGVHTIKTHKRFFLDWGGPEFATTVNVSRGEKAYVKYEVGGSADPSNKAVLAAGSLVLRQVSEAEALPEISQLRAVE